MPTPGRTLLFSGALGTTPDAQGWLGFTTLSLPPLLLPVQQSASGGGRSGTTRLLSPGEGLAAPDYGIGGYGNLSSSSPTPRNPAFPVLDRALGFSVELRLRINQESHGSDRNGDGLDDRAGFSLTVLASDGRGIELGFWTDAIWAQRGGPPGTLFTQNPGERVLHSTGRLTTYSLAVVGDRYVLSAGGRPILQGQVQDYSAFDPAASGLPLPYNPYTATSSIVLGDNSRSAGADVELASVAVNSPLLGSNGADRLRGGPGTDLLQGLGGDDTLRGGRGDDLLIGGAGADRFVYATGRAFRNGDPGRDLLIDFDPSEDRLLLSRTTFPGLASQVGGSLTAASDFQVVAGAAATARSTAPIVYDTLSGGLFHNPNGALRGFGSDAIEGGCFATLIGESNDTSTAVLSAAAFEVVA
jgi:Ca2+-binding RTX toxin-like protein